jgi:hypothetical protein
MDSLTDAEMAALDADYEAYLASSSCFICGDPADHSGVAHGSATGDGRTRADISK